VIPRCRGCVTLTLGTALYPARQTLPGKPRLPVRARSCGWDLVLWRLRRRSPIVVIGELKLPSLELVLQASIAPALYEVCCRQDDPPVARDRERSRYRNLCAACFVLLRCPTPATSSDRQPAHHDPAPGGRPPKITLAPGREHRRARANRGLPGVEARGRRHDGLFASRALAFAVALVGGLDRVRDISSPAIFPTPLILLPRLLAWFDRAEALL